MMGHLLTGLALGALAAGAAAFLGWGAWAAVLAFVLAGNLGVATSAGLAALRSRRRRPAADPPEVEAPRSTIRG